MTIEFISSAVLNGRKITLWRKGNYRYEIEVRIGDHVTSREFEAEYNDAVDIFNNYVIDLEQNFI